MKIKVTQDDIARGLSYTEDQCPLARAIKRVTHRRVSVHPWRFIVYHNDTDWTIYHLPPRAEKFVNDFNWGMKVKPFSFEAEPI